MARSGWFAAAFGAVAVAGGVVGRQVTRYEIADDSMRPALHPGDYVFVRCGSGERLRRGAIVVFPHPRNPSMDLVKRLVGEPGESITVSNGQVHVDGVVLAEPWADGPTHPDGSWQLGPGQGFVLGDARPRSTADSRALGPIDLDDVHGVVQAVYWPIRRIGLVGG